MKITLDKNTCIGCGACVAICPKYFEMGDDAKSRLKNAVKNKKNNQEKLTVKEIGCIKEASDSCPVKAILIKE